MQANRLEDKEKTIERNERIIAEKETKIMKKDKVIAGEKESMQYLKQRCKELERKIVQLESRRTCSGSKNRMKFKWREYDLPGVTDWIIPLNCSGRFSS